MNIEQLKKEILKAFEDCHSSDWVWNGLDDIRVDVFDENLAVEKVIEILTNHALLPKEQ